MEAMKAGGQRLFTPGTGAAPPALTGREREQEILGQCLADLLGGRAPPHDVALTGPRGNGKTVLLNWFERACRDAGRLAIARLSPARTRTGPALADLLLPASEVAARITDYYQDRYREMETRGLLPAAAAAARLFRTAATASDSALDAALAATGADAAGRLAVREELNALGYVWCPPGQLPPVVWVPGIPSLMAYLLDRAPS